MDIEKKGNTMRQIMIFILFMTNILLASNQYRVKDIRTNDTLSIREKPSIYSKKIGELPYNFFGLEIEKCIKVNTKSSIRNWCKIADNMGWVAKKYIEKTEDMNTQDLQYQNKLYKVIRDKKIGYLNVRKGMGTQYEIMFKLEHNAQNIMVWTCLKDDNNSSWCYIIKLPDNTSGIKLGWVSKKYIQRIDANSMFKKVEEYNNIALEAYNSKEYNKAIKYYKKSLDINIDIYGENNEEVVFSYQDLGSLYLAIGEYDRAKKVFTKGIDILSKIKNLKNKSLYLISISNLAEVCSYRQEYKEAKTYYDILVMLLKQKEDRETLRVIYNNISLMYQRKGDLDTAISYIIKAQKISFTIYSENDNRVADDFNHLALVYFRQGDYSNSIKNYKKALEIYEKNKNINGIRTACNNLGLLYSKLSDNNLSMSYYNRVLKIIKDYNVKENIDVATIYNNIGLVNFNMNNTLESLKYHKKALNIRKKYLKEEHLDIALSYHNLGSIYRELKDYNISKEYLENALKIRKKVLGDNNTDTAYSYIELGNLLVDMDKSKEALPYLKKGVDIREKVLGLNHIDTASSYGNLSNVYFKLYDYQKGYIFLNKRFKSYLNSIVSVFLSLDSSQKNRYINNSMNIGTYLYNTYYSTTLSLKSIKKETMLKDIFDNWINFKGTITESSNLITMLYETSDKETKDDIDRFRDLTKNLSNLQQNSKNTKNIKEQISQLEIKLNESSAKFREFKNLQNISYKDISKILKDDELYIDFAKTDKNYYIFTLDKSNHITFEELSEKHTKFLEQNIQRFRQNNKNNATKSIKETQKTLLDIYTTLAQHIDFKSKKSLIISTDGLLNFLPFEALYDGEKYLVESVNISYIPSGRELVRQSRREKSTNNSKDVVIFGDIDYGLNDDITSDKKSLNLMHYLPQLTSSKEEIDTLYKLYPKAKIYQDKMATVENLFKIKSPKILHLSTHGKFVDDKNTTNPMQQTILAFSDANYAILEKDYRGIATALKLSSLSLNNTELVFLSACETGLGTIQTAEGVQGLPKAFIQAGAKNIIMSLWQVDDSKTTELTRYFYENIKSGMGYKEALREAKLKMIKMHPYYWSGFVFSGGGI